MSDGNVVRELTVEDLYVFQDIIGTWFHEAHQLNFPGDKFDLEAGKQRCASMINYIKNEQGNVLGVIENNDLRGFLWYFKTSANRFHVNEIIVSPAYRSGGYGKLLLENLFTIGKNAKISQIELFVTCDNHVAVNFYDKYDFKPERLFLTKDL